MGACLAKPKDSEAEASSRNKPSQIRLGDEGLTKSELSEHPQSAITNVDPEIEDSALDQELTPGVKVKRAHFAPNLPGKPPLPQRLAGEAVGPLDGRQAPSGRAQMGKASFRSRKAHRQSSELRKSAEFWEHKDVHSLNESDLVEHYHKDSELILQSLTRLQQRLKDESSDAMRPAEIDRASVSLKANSSNSGRALKTGLTSQPSENVSLCGEEGLVPGLPNKSLKVLLSNDPLIIGARDDIADGRMLSAQTRLRMWAKRHGIKITELQEHIKETGINVEELERHCTIIERALESHRNEDGYRVARDDGELRVLYKSSNKGKYHCVKMEATLPFPLERPLSLAREFDLMKQWNKYISESDRLYAPTIWESYVYAGMWMPFPFPQMEVLGKGRGYDLAEEHKCLMIACESVEEEDLPTGSKPLPKPKKKHHRAEVIPGSSIRLEPLPPFPGDAGRTKGTIVMVIDAHVPHVPAFIINWVLGVMAPFAHKQIKSLLQNEYDDPRKMFPKRMAEPENQLLYQKVRTSVQKGLERHYGGNTTILTKV